MSDYDAVFYYASGETADFPPQAADFYEGLVAAGAGGGIIDILEAVSSIPFQATECICSLRHCGVW